MLVHVGEKKNTRISTSREGSILHMKGYQCKENCKICPLHKVGEDIEKENCNCEKLSGSDILMSLKVDFSLIGEISFV